jgi:hypothetical protein
MKRVLPISDVLILRSDNRGLRVVSH